MIPCVAANWSADRTFSPATDPDARAEADARYADWRRAVERARDWDQT